MKFCFHGSHFCMRMSLRHMENMPLHHASPPGAQRPCWKPWVFSTLVLVLLVCSFSTVAFTLFPLKKIGVAVTGVLDESRLCDVAVSEPCVAKFGPLPSRWQMASPEPPCVSQIADWKLKILRDGLYSIYGQVAPNKTYKEPAPFEVRLRKNKGIIQVLTNTATIQNVGGTYELHAGDIIDLIFNADHQVLKNNTYWGVILLANPQFISLES